MAETLPNVRRLEAGLDVSLDAVYIAEPGSLRIAYVNDEAARQAGRSRQDLVGRPLIEVLPLLDAAAALNGGRTPTGQDDRDAPPVRTMATVLRPAAGDLLPVDVSVRQIDFDVGRSFIVAVVRDSTERIESQARLRRLVERERAHAAELETILAAIGDAVIVCSADGHVSLANPASRQLFARTDISTYAELCKRLDDPDGLAPRLGAPVRQGPVELQLRGSPKRWLELSAYPVFGSHPLEATGWSEPASATIFVIRDVTAAREARRTREAFLGVLSHELRTPVTTILAGTKVLGRRRRMTARARAELFSDIEAEAERLYRIVEDLLVLTRFDEAPDAVADEPLLLQRILPRLVVSEERRWPGHAIRLQLPATLTTVRGDRTYVEQIVRNLLGNACKYSPSGSAVDVRVEEKKNEVRVRIRDAGPGFDPRESGRLFELFYRSPTTLDAVAGAGIGLYVCRRLVEAMDGRIWARAVRGGGAEFGFALRTLSEEEP